MTGFGIVLDPPAAVGRTQLDLNSGSIQTVGGEGHGIDWGESAIKAFLSEQQYGEAGTDFRVPNRIITIPLVLVGNSRVAATAIAEQEAARRQLAQKVGLMQREGGVLMRQRGTNGPLYADIVTASLIVPDIWEGAIEPNVVLKLETLPDFYGEEIELDAVEENGQIAAVLKDAGATAVIAGDYPGRGRIVLTEKSSHDQRSLLWGLRSTHYDAASSAALFFDAYTLNTINGAITGTEAGTFSGKAAKLFTPEPNTWHPFLELTSSGKVPPSHVGTYRVWARVATTAGNRLRLAWSVNGATASTFNPAMAFTAGGGWQLMDLGEIRLEEPPVGEHWWTGTIQLETGAVSNAVWVDRIWLQPLDDGAGKLRATGVPSSTLLKPVLTPTTAANAESGTAWSNPGNAIKAGEYASAALGGFGATQYLELTKPGFAIPSGAEIKGVEVRVPFASFSGLGGKGAISGQLVKAGSLVGSPISPEVGTTWTGLALGGPSSLWGTTWTAAQINASNFGVGLKMNSNSASSVTAVIQGAVTVRVYFAIGATTITQDAVLFSGRVTEARTDGAFREYPSATAYARVSEETGDLVRIPPSGIEQRPVQLLVKNSRGLLPEPGSPSAGEADSGIDKIQAQVFYRPCYLGRI